jgi:hypothetical protein
MVDSSGLLSSRFTGYVAKFGTCDTLEMACFRAETKEDLEDAKYSAGGPPYGLSYSGPLTVWARELHPKTNKNQRLGVLKIILVCTVSVDEM